MLKPIDTLKEFINIPSVSGNESAFAEHLYNYLKDTFTADTLELQEVSENRCNVILKKGNPALALTSHIDTVPTDLTARIENNILYGTGACDAKGQIVTQLYALQQAIKDGLADYACYYVVGEEVDSCGAVAAVKYPLIRGQAILNGEPTDNLFIERTRGVLELTCMATGVKHHSSQIPINSAIHNIIPVLSALLAIETTDFSINIGTITGGDAPNVSAEAASADLCIRTNIASKDVLRQLEAAVPNLEYRVTSLIEPLSLDVPAEYRDSAISVPFCTDSAHFAPNFKTNMLFGPGSIKDAHSLHEHISLEQITTGAAIITKLLLDMNGLAAKK